MNEQYKLIPIAGFKAYGLHSGVKKAKKDLCLVYCEDGAVAGGVYTQNVYKAAPVVVSMENMKRSQTVKALLVNSGNANACTGTLGMDNCHRKIGYLAEKLGVEKEQILLSSTGVIGKQLDMDKIIPGIQGCLDNLSFEGMSHVAESITTTDTVEKYSTVVYADKSGESVSVTGVAKGSGMIHPNMATMLCFAFTDANISKELLQKATYDVSQDTFNMISVDGDTSTNDMAITMASCKSKALPITSDTSDEYALFREALFRVYESLAIQIAKDGEGATKLIEVNVKNASDKMSARTLARSVTTSSLVKAAIFGCDANWGRIVCALGYSGASFNPDAVDVSFSSASGAVPVLESGQPIAFDEDIALKVLKEDKIIIDIDMNAGEASATAWGCDLTYEYVKINGEYRS
jgi:glutamate N-acetyltransferase / amino-acid N-acetyltransferase